MIEIKGDFWRIQADWKCVPTNGSLRVDGRAVFKKGLAKQACDRFPDIEYIAGQSQQKLGNVFRKIRFCYDDGFYSGNPYSYYLFAFPTKDIWQNIGSLHLIQESIVRMRAEWKRVNTKQVLLPRVGCGEGLLDWEHEIKPMLTELLPEDHFLVCYF